MKSWKGFSLYHILKDRWDNKFIKQTAVDFFSGICRVDGLSASLFLPINVIGLILVLYFNLTLIQWVLIDAALFTMATVTVSAIDTYMMRKMRIRVEAIKSIELIVGIVERKRWP